MMSFYVEIVEIFTVCEKLCIENPVVEVSTCYKILSLCTAHL